MFWKGERIMDGFFDFLTTASSGSVPAGIVIAAGAVVVCLVIALAIMKFTAPIGEGIGHGVGKVGDSLEHVATGVEEVLGGVGSTLGAPGTLAQGLADKWRIDAEAKIETFDLLLTDGAGRSVQIKAHGPQTAPKMPDVMSGVPMLPAPPPDAVIKLVSGKKKGK